MLIECISLMSGMNSAKMLSGLRQIQQAQSTQQYKATDKIEKQSETEPKSNTFVEPEDKVTISEEAKALLEEDRLKRAQS